MNFFPYFYLLENSPAAIGPESDANPSAERCKLLSPIFILQNPHALRLSFMQKLLALVLTLLTPQNSATRAQVATVLMRYIENMVK